MSKKLVIMDHDGGIDDFIATILLMTMEQVEPIGVVVTPADCYIPAAVRVTRKILDLMEKSSIVVAESKVRGLNPFPPSYRKDSVIIDNFPILNEQPIIKTTQSLEPGQMFMVQKLQLATSPVTLMVTGPLTTVAKALEIEPGIEDKIKEIVWMGGAVNVPGNVEKQFALEHDGSAEWNVYWDPFAAATIWQTEIPLILCPLDLTNTVPVSTNFIRQLAAKRRYPLCDLVGLCYSLAIPQNYYFWDVLATAYLAHPEFYQVGVCETKIVTTGVSQGRTLIEPGGRQISVMEKVDQDSFYSYLLEQFAG